MIDTSLRKHIQKGFDATAKGLHLHKLHPNYITVFGFLVGVASALLLGFGRPFPALVFLWISGALDVLDGTVARLANKSSKFGAYLDLIFDRLVEGFLVLGFFFFRPQFALAYFLFFIFAMFNFSTFMLAGTLFANTGKKSMHYDSGLIERTETFVCFSLMMLFPGWIFIILNIFNVLMAGTGIRRMVRIFKHERRAKRE